VSAVFLIPVLNQLIISDALNNYDLELLLTQDFLTKNCRYYQ